MNSPYSSLNVWTEGFRQEPQPSGMERGALNFDRRDFLKGLGAGLLVAMASGEAWAQESGRGFGWGSILCRRIWTRGCTLLPMAR